MNTRTIKYLAFSAILTILLLTICTYRSSNEKPRPERVKIETKHHKTGTFFPFWREAERSGEITEPVKIEKLTSGPVSEVPWADEEEFRSAAEKNGTPVLMAAYRTVLKDPLPGEEFNVHLAARMIAGTVIPPGQFFSQNRTAGPYVESRGYQKGPTYVGSKLTTTIGGGVCKIASTLYNVTVLSNLQVLERFPHSMPVPYVPYGQDATVSYGNKDFKFRNNTPFPVMIWAVGIDNVLYMGFYGSEKPPAVEWHHETLEVTKASTIYKNNPSLPAGSEKRVLEGMDGARVRSWITITTEEGDVTTRQMGISSYRPMSHIVERGG